MTYDAQLLEKYAELAIRVGINVQKGQRLLIAAAPLALAPLVHLLTKHAYLAGARFVEVEWHDRQLDLLRLEYGWPQSAAEFSDWPVQLAMDYLEQGDATLSVVGNDPDIMAGQDPDALAAINKKYNEKWAPTLDKALAFSSTWSMIAGATPGWAQKVFPQQSPEEAQASLWDAIFEVCRLHTADPVTSWRTHVSSLEARQDYLTNKVYKKLHYQAPGTDLTVGLPAGHRWQSGGLVAGNGVYCLPNLPTEEVFTIPHRNEIEGFVSSTKPRGYAGVLVDNFTLVFENGRVVKATAETGETVLNNLLDTDEGARSLGEVALVPHSSPISQSGILFYNTLFDENASNHLALGSALKINLQDGHDMSDEEFLAAGGNHSLVHIDFMVGSAEMDVDGYLADGTAEPVMRGGEWAFDV